MLGVGELALRGDAGLKEARLPVGGDLAAIGGDNAVAMRVHRVVVDPVAVVVASEIQLAGGDHGVLALAVDVVFIDGERVGESVILL